MKRNALSLAALLSLAAFAAGCSGTPTVDQVRWEIQRRVPEAQFEQEEHIALGRLSLGLVRGLLRMVPGEVESPEVLTSVRRLEVATYRVSDLPDLADLDKKLRFEKRLAQDGWAMTMRTREAGSRAWVFMRDDGKGALRNLFVVDLDDSELTLVRIDGRLSEAFAAAIADRPKDAVRRVQGEEDGETGI
jgi:Domain of unknown function (DUF4252)